MSPDLVALGQQVQALLKRNATLTAEQQAALPGDVGALSGPELSGLLASAKPDDMALLRSVLPQGPQAFRGAVQGVVAAWRFGGDVPWNATALELGYLANINDQAFAAIKTAADPMTACLLAMLHESVPPGTVGPSTLEASEIRQLLGMTQAQRVQALADLAAHEQQQAQGGEPQGVEGGDTDAPPDEEQADRDEGAADEQDAGDELSSGEDDGSAAAKTGTASDDQGTGITGWFKRLNTPAKVALGFAAAATLYIAYEVVTHEEKPAPRRLPRGARTTRGELPAPNPRERFSAARYHRESGRLSELDQDAIRRRSPSARELPPGPRSAASTQGGKGGKRKKARRVGR